MYGIAENRTGLLTHDDLLEYCWPPCGPETGTCDHPETALLKRFIMLLEEESPSSEFLYYPACGGAAFDLKDRSGVSI